MAVSFICVASGYTYIHSRENCRLSRVFLDLADFGGLLEHRFFDFTSGRLLYMALCTVIPKLALIVTVYRLYKKARFVFILKLLQYSLHAV